MTANTDETRGDRFVLWILLAVFFSLLIRTAWLCDDAFITFRVSDNFLHGYGLRWNAAERVQAYTHPLWMFLVTAAYWLTGDVYYTSIALCIALSVLAVARLAFGLAASTYQAILALTIFCLTKTFLDFSTSGLENPLAHLLIVLFAIRYFRGTTDPRALRTLAILAGLATLNRLDALALLGPPLLAAAWPHRWARAIKALAIGFAPLAVWTVFSLFYYGFALPNTVYAKLNTGVPRRELAQQGLHYLFNSLSLDPLTMVAIALGLVVATRLGPAGARAMAAGVALHLVYVVRVGGDFMSGRFLAAPLLVAVVLIARAPIVLPLPSLAMALAAVAAVGLYGPYPPLTTTSAFYASRGERYGLLDERGITDERAIYYRGTGLMTASREEPMPGHYMARTGRRARVDGTAVVTRGAMGMYGFFAGPGVHVIDPNGLADAFLARVPAGPGWRIGHFDRRLPPGYEATIRKGALRIDDPKLSDFYRKLRLVIRGDLWDGKRLAAIWDLNLGAGRHLVDDYWALHSRRQRVRLADVATAHAAGSGWNEGTQLFSDHGLDVDIGEARAVATIELSLDGNDNYKLIALRGGHPVWEAAIQSVVPASPGLAVYRVAPPAPPPFDTLRLLPVTGDQQYSLGHLVLEGTPAAPAAPTPEPEGATPTPTPVSDDRAP